MGILLGGAGPPDHNAPRTPLCHRHHAERSESVGMSTWSLLAAIWLVALLVVVGFFLHSIRYERKNG